MISALNGVVLNIALLRTNLLSPLPFQVGFLMNCGFYKKGRSFGSQVGSRVQGVQ